MELRTGDRVRVNLAAFIGSATRSGDSVECVVLGLAGDDVEVRAEPPYRPVSLNVDRIWIDGPAAHNRRTVHA